VSGDVTVGARAKDAAAASDVMPSHVQLAYRWAALGYGAKRVLSDVSLDVCSGEVVGLVGPNGAGKSTMLRAVTGAADVLSGSVVVAGADARELTSQARARAVAVVPQQVSAAFSLPSRDFVEMGRHPHLARFARPGVEDHAIAARAMKATDTLHLAERPVDELSGGDVQRLALAQALTQEPRVLLLDEPVSHLDLNHRLQILDLVRDLADRGMAVLAVFHDLDLAARYSDRIGVVTDGALRPADAPGRVITAQTVGDVFGVRAVVGTDPVSGTVSVTPVLRDGAVEPAEAQGRVLLVAGSGSGAALMRRLVLDGWQLEAAALNSGDVDQAVAEALGIEHTVLPPFGAVDDDARRRTASLARAADALLVCAVPFGGGNIANLETVVDAAVERGRPLVLLGDIEGRDFTHGRARELWHRAVEGGAVVVPDPEDLVAVEAALARVCRRPL
jgi:iron complex transport system ATP-binding protein